MIIYTCYHLQCLKYGIIFNLFHWEHCFYDRLGLPLMENTVVRGNYRIFILLVNPLLSTKRIT